MRKVCQKRKKKNKNTRNTASRYSKMEDVLITFIDEQRRNKISVNMRDIVTKALELIKVYYPKADFKGSNGWFCRFLNRTSLSRRTPTHIMTKLSEGINQEIIKYLNSLKTHSFEKVVNPQKCKILL